MGYTVKANPRFSPTPKQMESHWAHHREVRKQDFSDDCYVEGLDSWRTRNEIMSLAVVATVLSAAAYPFSKGMALSFWYCAGKLLLCASPFSFRARMGKKTYSLAL